MTYPKTERIRCPECGTEQDAVVELEAWMPFPAYVHHCGCGHIITESDWERVVTTQEAK